MCRLRSHWRALDSAVTSVDVLRGRDMLVVGGRDCNVSLWTYGGALVGVLGEHAWDLERPATWQDPHAERRREPRGVLEGTYVEQQVGARLAGWLAGDKGRMLAEACISGLASGWCRIGSGLGCLLLVGGALRAATAEGLLFMCLAMGCDYRYAQVQQTLLPCWSLYCPAEQHVVHLLQAGDKEEAQAGQGAQEPAKAAEEPLMVQFKTWKRKVAMQAALVEPANSAFSALPVHPLTQVPLGVGKSSQMHGGETIKAFRTGKKVTSK